MNVFYSLLRKLNCSTFISSGNRQRINAYLTSQIQQCLLFLTDILWREDSYQFYQFLKSYVSYLPQRFKSDHSPPDKYSPRFISFVIKKLTCTEKFTLTFYQIKKRLMYQELMKDIEDYVKKTVQYIRICGKQSLDHSNIFRHDQDIHSFDNKKFILKKWINFPNFRTHIAAHTNQLNIFFRAFRKSFQ